MTDLESYYEARAAEAARLAEIAQDERARNAHQQFAQAYRDRLRQVCASRNQAFAERA
ncbi:hypothetical protein [Glacieibacterium frigidum]|uniref:hypothetical protein n=1 Tax=Glacieibacterium frigidum TaxID=2593303 RepID=UPI00163D55EA|nr:hypothetical protein [Glacieibacterium frigidum]